MKIIEKLKKFWNETLGPDYTEAELVGLNIHSNNPIEVELAESTENIRNRNYDIVEKRNLKRKDILDSTRVDESQLNKKVKKQKYSEYSEKSDDFVK